MSNQIHLSNAHLFNHGCSNYAVADDNGDGTAIVVSVQNCTSCWQVGHDGDYQYAKVGQIINLVEWQSDLIPEEELALPA